MQKLMMSLPWRASAFTSASTTKAFSVPNVEARRLISGMRGPEKVLIMPPHAGQLRGVPGGPQARRNRQARDPQLSHAPRLLRLGGAEGSNRGGARGDAGGVRPARAGGRGRAPRPPAAQDRGVR